MDIRIENLEADLAKLTRRLIAKGKKGHDEAIRIVREVTEKTQEEAILRVPVDEGFAEKSIESHVEGGRHVDEVEGSVFVPANSPAADYMIWLHEGDYKLGKKSKEKQAVVGPKMGRKFIERALEENKEPLGLYIQKEIVEFLERD